MGILIWLLIGLVAGALARLLVPGTDPMGWGGTLILGLAGSLVGGFLGNLIADQDFDVSAAGLLGSVVGAIIVLLIFRSMRSRT
ncbi:MAG: GlsB/YeaQ/YmgE family stress response membrane protein [Actinomycetota bacterium]|nr:GlsB/YeaQ/YmgE family stress response membrane protein [Actinomycetota bacterium]